jgi:hypothetical protein
MATTKLTIMAIQAMRIVASARASLGRGQVRYGINPALNRVFAEADLMGPAGVQAGFVRFYLVDLAAADLDKVDRLTGALSLYLDEVEAAARSIAR